MAHDRRIPNNSIGLPLWLASSGQGQSQGALQIAGAAAIVLATLRNPLPGLVELSQVALVGFALAVFIRAPRRQAREWQTFERLGLFLPLVLSGWLICATMWNVLLGGNIDFVQCIRDFRDIAIFSVGLTAVGLLDREALAGLMQLSLFAIGAGCLVELLTRHSGIYGLLFEPEFMGYRARAGFQGPNEYGALASIAVAMGVGWALEHSRLRERIAGLGIALIAAIALAGTLSRGGLGGAIIATGLVVATFGWDAATSGRAGRWLRVGAIVCALMVAVWATSVIASQSRSAGIIEMAASRLAGGAVEVGASDRVALMTAAFEVGANQPIAGGGLGAFAAQNSSVGGTGTLSPHNELAMMFASGGVVGAAILLLWNVSLLIVTVRARRAPGGYAALGAIVAFLIAEQFFTYIVRPGLSVVMAVLLASAMSPDSLDRRLRSDMSYSGLGN